MIDTIIDRIIKTATSVDTDLVYVDYRDELPDGQVKAMIADPFGWEFDDHYLDWESDARCKGATISAEEMINAYDPIDEEEESLIDDNWEDIVDEVKEWLMDNDTSNPFSDTRVKDIDFTDIDPDEQFGTYGTDPDEPDYRLYSNNGEELVISHEWEVNPVSYLPDEHPLFRDFIETCDVDTDATEEQIELLDKAEDVLLAWVTDWCRERGIGFDCEWLEHDYARWEFCVTEPLDSEASMREVEERLNPVVNLITVGSYALHQHLVDWANEQEEA